MAIKTDDFNKIWASASPLTPYSFSGSQYKEGWNFIGSTPPSRQMWDYLQKNNDEKMQYLLNHFDNYLPLSGGTLTGDVDITGDLSVSGAITGNVTGNVTGTATSATNDGNGNNIASTYLPAVVGAVVAFAGSTTPQGWLLCDGSAVSRTDYAALYAVIGTTYGAGDGSSTFNLPNLVDKFVEGSATSGTVKSAGLPNITGTLLGSGSYSIDNESYFTGAFAYTNAVKSKTFGSDEKNEKWNSAADFDASRSSSVYGNSTTVQPPALTMRYIIKY